MSLLSNALTLIILSRCGSLYASQHKWYKRTDRTVYNDIALLNTHDDLDFSTSHAVQPVPYLANRKLDYLATRARNDKCVTIGDGVLVSTIGDQDFGRVLFLRRTIMVNVLYYSIGIAFRLRSTSDKNIIQLNWA